MLMNKVNFTAVQLWHKKFNLHMYTVKKLMYVHMYDTYDVNILLFFFLPSCIVVTVETTSAQSVVIRKFPSQCLAQQVIQIHTQYLNEHKVQIIFQC